MRFERSLLVVGNIIAVRAFVLSSNGGGHGRRTATPNLGVIGGAANDSPLRDVVLSRIQQQKEQLNEEMAPPPPPPKLFSDDLLDDMQQVLLVLEKRVKQGPGSLTAIEVMDFSARTKSILVEMKGASSQQQQQQPQPQQQQSTFGASPKSTEFAPPQPQPAAHRSTTTTTSSKQQDGNELEDGPGYSPDGGFGSLARGTTNTYVIPGMDAMSPEEYQQALQQSIIDRQAKRKASGAYGNLAAQDYLTQLGSKSGMLK